MRFMTTSSHDMEQNRMLKSSWKHGLKKDRGVFPYCTLLIGDPNLGLAPRRGGPCEAQVSIATQCLDTGRFSPRTDSHRYDSRQSNGT
jgi:hypothetical protein